MLNIIELDDLLVQKLTMTFHEMFAPVSVNAIGMQNESVQYPNDTDRCQRKVEQTGDVERYKVSASERGKVTSKKPNGDKNKTV